MRPIGQVYELQKATKTLESAVVCINGNIVDLEEEKKWKNTQKKEKKRNKNKYERNKNAFKKPGVKSKLLKVNRVRN